MRFGLERMRRLMTALDSPHERFRSIHVLGSNGKSSTVQDDRRAARAPRPAHRRVPVAAPRLLGGAGRGRRPAGAGRALRGRDRARGRGRRARGSHARPRRSRDAVRGAHRGGLLGAGPRRRRGGGGGGGPRRAVRRDQRDPLPRAGADQREPRAHALARPDRAPHRRGEARGRARGRHRRRRAAGRGGARRRGARDGASVARGSAAGAATSTTPVCRCIPAVRSSARTSRSRWPRRRPSTVRSTRRRCGTPRRPCAPPAASRSWDATRSRSSTARTTPRARVRSRDALEEIVGGRPLVGVMSVLDDKDASKHARDPAAAVRRGRIHALVATAARSRPRRSRALRASSAARRRRSSPRRGAALATCTRACGPRRRGGRDRLHISAVGSGARCDPARPHARIRRARVAVVILVFFALGYGLGAAPVGPLTRRIP